MYTWGDMAGGDYDSYESDMINPTKITINENGYEQRITVKAFVVTSPHEMCEILGIYVFEMIFIAQFIK